MPDIIQLLPDAVANQIAAGEVVQRPASVVKELVENAIDAGATEITLNLKDAGKTLIQVVDNGCGMSATDARMAFERHATSKIQEANDLFNIRTMGFRGEALASIAAVAQVELRTKKHEDEIGAEICIKGSEIIEQNNIQTTCGSQFLVKNLFFNIPARRKFLKKDSTEFKHILDEFQRVAIVYTDIHFKLIHNGQEVYNLPVSNQQKRLVNIFGKALSKELVPIYSESPLVKVTGFIGKPESAKKRSGQQFFFVNHRFMRHPYFFRTVMNTYQDILSSDYYPLFFINLDVPTDSIDINIHPTKTEIKFEDERVIAQIISATVREAIGSFNLTSSMNFDEHQIEIAPNKMDKEDVSMPSIHINPEYNPFKQDIDNQTPSYSKHFEKKASQKAVNNWMDMLKSTAHQPQEEQTQFFEQEVDNENTAKTNTAFQISLKYIVSPSEKGMMIIHQRRAHQRILYEKYLKGFQQEQVALQQLVFPIEHPLSANHLILIEEMLPDLNQIGFNIQISKEAVTISGLPVDMTEKQAVDTLDDMMERFAQLNTNIDYERQKFIAKSMSKKASVGYVTLSQSEMQQIISDLFQTSEPSYCPSGKRIFSMISLNDIEQMLRI